MESAPCLCWALLPCDAVKHVAQVVGPATAAQARLVCKGWRLSLPLAHCRIWVWEDGMQGSLAPHVLSLEVLAPLPHLDASPLLALPACARLHSLTLHHVRAAALPALAGLTRLQRLDATVFFPDAAPGWLDWASGLRCLQELRLAAAMTHLQPEESLAALLPLRRCLTDLRLDGCLLLTDAGAQLLAQLSLLESLEVTACQVSQAGLDGLAAALPRLARAELRLHDSIAGDRLVAATRVAAGGSLAVHVSGAKANALVAAAGQQMPGLGRLAVTHVGCSFLLTAPPTFHRLTALTSLSLPRIQLPPDAVHQLAACTALQRLDVEFSFRVRDDALAGWRALRGMQRLRLAGNFYLSEGAVAGELRLEQLHGSGGMLAPMAAMPRLRSLSLASCHLNDADALARALCSASGLTGLSVQDCGIQSEVCEAVAAALRCLRGLRDLELGLRRALAPSAGDAIALACAGSTHLTALQVSFPSYNYVAPAVPAWHALSALTALRRLHVGTGVGWDGAALAAVAGAATALRELTITDNADLVDERWVAALPALRQLSRLELNSCRQLGAGAAPLLAQLTALTRLACFRCNGMGAPEVQHQLRAALPCLARLDVHE
ncbi:F-box LRR-repeat 14 [Micractinium conductrix]|uniref:F-box LRR-repeat 14 n=1 Tax=Micractinium conductrix TaxID=554055 RepID=A0A2P6VL91_9CHLO|nr:F-box LRR-repeat 14 [Micractinium conductrix]|eukprot:PSC74844.1 F-box LRR-repeat 14 [Micractinium conductrix]